MTLVNEKQIHPKLSKKIPFLGFQVDASDWNETIEKIHEAVREGKPVQHCVLNAYKIFLSQKDPRLAEIIKSCRILQADGVSIVWAGRLLGLPAIPHISGIDLMERLLHEANKNRYRVYFLGGRQVVIEKLREYIGINFPNIVISGMRKGYFDNQDVDSVVREISESNSHILFVGISSPMKEYWISSHLKKLNTPFCMGVGGSFDVLTGESRRAPQWVQKMGLEWLYRWVQEPRRLAHRYIVGNCVFIYLVLREWMKNFKTSAPRKTVPANKD